MIYHILFFILILGGYLYFKGKASINAKDGFLIWACCLMILQSGLRHVAVGDDTYNYMGMFNVAQNNSWDFIWQAFYETYVLGEGKDPGYFVLQKLFGYITTDFTYFLLAVAVLFFYAWGTLVKRYTSTIDEVLTSVGIYYLLFYTFFSITGIRQTISVALGILAFLAMVDKKYVRFICFLIPAFFIHKSAGIIVLFPFLYRIRNQSLLWKIVVFAFVVDFIYRTPIMKRFVEVADYDTEFHSRPPYNLMVLLFVLSLSIYNYIRQLPQHDDARKLFNMYAITFAWIPLLGWDSLFMRQVLFFSVYVSVLVPKSLMVHNRLAYKAFTAFCFLYFLLLNSAYAFFWQEMDLGGNYN